MNLNEIYEQAEQEDKLVAVVKYPYQKPEVVTTDKGLAPIRLLQRRGPVYRNGAELLPSRI